MQPHNCECYIAVQSRYSFARISHFHYLDTVLRLLNSHHDVWFIVRLNK